MADIFKQLAKGAKDKKADGQSAKAFQEISASSRKSIFASRRSLNKLNPELAGLQAEVLMDTARLDALSDLKQKDADRLVNAVAKEEADVQKALQTTYTGGLEEVQTAVESYTQDLQSLYYRSTQEKDSIYGKNTKPIEEEYLPALDTIVAAIKADKLLNVRNGELRKPLLAYAGKIHGELTKRTTLTNKLKQSALGLVKSDVAMGILVGAATKSPLLALAAFALKQRQKRNDYRRKAETTRRQLKMKTAQTQRGQSVEAKMEERRQKQQEQAQQEEEARLKKQEEIEKKKAAGLAKSQAKKSSSDTANGGDQSASAATLSSDDAGTTATAITDSETLTATRAVPETSPLIVDAYGSTAWKQNADQTISTGGAAAPVTGKTAPTGQLNLPFGGGNEDASGVSVLDVLNQHTELLQKIYGVNEDALKFQKELEAKRQTEAESAEDESSGATATQLKLPLGGEQKEEEEGGGLLSTAMSLFSMLRGGGLRGLGGAVLRKLPGGKLLGGLANRAGGFIGKAGGLTRGLGGRLGGLASKVGLGAAAGATATAVASSSADDIAKTATKAIGTEAAEAATKTLGKKAAETGAKKGIAAAIKGLIKKKVPSTIGKIVGKGIPGLGWLIGGGFAISRLMKGDVVGAGLELGASAGSLLTSIPLTIVSLARDIYTESYGTPPEADPESAPRLEEVKTGVTGAVDEELEKLGLKEKKKDDAAIQKSEQDLAGMQQSAKAETPPPTGGGTTPTATEAPPAPTSAPSAPSGPAPSTGGATGAAPTPTAAPAPSAPPPQPEAAKDGFWTRLGKGIIKSAMMTTPVGMAYYAYQKAKEIQSEQQGPAGKVDEKNLPEQPPPNVQIGPKTDLSKVDKKLLKRFYGFAKEFGQAVTINSAYRGDEYQAQLWVRGNIFHEPGIHTPAKPEKTTTITYRGQQFTVPGSGKGSKHGKGLALDVTVPGMGAMSGPVDVLLKKYGLKRPFLPKDPPHIELAEGGGGQLGDTATPAEAKKDAAAAQSTAQPFGGGKSGGGGGGASWDAPAPTPAPTGGAAPATATPTTAPSAPAAPSATPTMDATTQGRSAVASGIANVSGAPTPTGGTNTTVIQGGSTMVGGGGKGAGAQQPIPAPIDREPTIRRILDGTLH